MVRGIRLPLNRPLAILLLSLLAVIIGLEIYYFQLITIDWESLDILGKLKEVFGLIINHLVILWFGSGLLALTISYLNGRRDYRITVKILCLWLLFGLFGLIGILFYILCRGQSKSI